jgi:hypothetical protein
MPGPYYLISAMFLSLALALGLGYAYVNKLDREARAEVQKAREEANKNDRRWCQLMIELDNAYNDPATAPTTELGRRIASTVHELRLNLGCD